MHYLVFTYLSVVYCVNNASPTLRIHTPPLFHVELEKDGWE